MASKEAREAAGAASDGAHTATAQNKKRDLDDPDTQIAIETPPEVHVKIGGKQVRLFPLAFTHAKDLAALCVDIMRISGNELTGYDLGDDTRKNVLTHQTLQPLLQQFKGRFLPLVVHATAEADSYSDATASARAVALDREIGFPEQPFVYYAMLEQNDIFKTHLGIDVKALAKEQAGKKGTDRPS
jgi:hypothetical protein